ncbi:MAG: hypothetical protein IPP15_23430 [Saprospiraceae bacterium]|uniref:Uncharacterized protein n=1 Tax=Candidatus Opimibacter skivensis TaxID=2982028 RepID=A0A9D7SZX8_9BACT|nr:hypothetical protein [Candidatus Opimibacter skivensis]
MTARRSITPGKRSVFNFFDDGFAFAAREDVATSEVPVILAAGYFNAVITL